MSYERGYTHFEQMQDVCAARNGERCKDCIYLKPCERFRQSHNNIKPGNYDPVKYKIMQHHFATKERRTN